MRSRSIRLVDIAYLGVGVGAAGLLRAQELVLMTCICLVNHGLSSFMRAHPQLVQHYALFQTKDHSGKKVSAVLAARDSNMKIREVLGLVFFSLSLFCLECYDNRSGGGEGANKASISSLITFIVPQQTPASLSLLVAMGFLIFDHIYAVFFCEPPPRNAWVVLEDLVTMSVLLSALSTPLSSSSSSLTIPIRLWLAYKIMRPTILSGMGSKKQLKRQRINLSIRGSTVSSDAPTKSNDNTGSKTLLSDQVMMTKAIPSASLFLDRTMLWEIDGIYYDLMEFVNQHPGGKEALLLGQGRDCTALVESYHPFSKSKVRQVLGKYRHTSPLEQPKHQTPQEQADFFYDLLCQRVAKVLKEKRIDPISGRGATCGRLFYYSLIGTGVFVSAYYHAKGSVFGSFSLGAFGWLIGALGHDAGHFSCSRHAWINDIGVWGMTLLCNPIVWQHQHTYAHHSFTNDFDHDPDIHHFDNMIRVHRRFKHSPLFRYQTNFFFVVFAYAFVVFGTCFWIPLGVIREGSLYGLVEWTDRKRPMRAAGMFLHLACYFLFIMVLPFWTMSWYWALTAVVVHLATSGLSFAFFSQINHINEASLVDDSTRVAREANRDPRLLKSWAVEQVETSNNFCTNSFAWHIISNGLNLQIEHHLFPGLNHCHLHHIAPVVQATCKEFGVCYKTYDGWTDIFAATLAWLDKLAESE